MGLKFICFIATSMSSFKTLSLPIVSSTFYCHNPESPSTGHITGTKHFRNCRRYRWREHEIFKRNRLSPVSQGQDIGQKALIFSKKSTKPLVKKGLIARFVWSFNTSFHGLVDE